MILCLGSTMEISTDTKLRGVGNLVKLTRTLDSGLLESGLQTPGIFSRFLDFFPWTPGFLSGLFYGLLDSFVDSGGLLNSPNPDSSRIDAAISHPSLSCPLEIELGMILGYCQSNLPRGNKSIFLLLRQHTIMLNCIHRKMLTGPIHSDRNVLNSNHGMN